MAGIRRVGLVAPLVLAFLFEVTGHAEIPSGFVGNEVRDSPLPETARGPFIVEQVDNVPWRRRAATVLGDFVQDPALGGVDVLIPPPDGPPTGMWGSSSWRGGP